MITRALIEEIVDTYSVRLRIPYLNGAKGAHMSTATQDLNIARVSVPQAMMPRLHIGDAVFVGFEDNDYGKPVILGYLYTSTSSDIRGASFFDSIQVDSQAKLPPNTTIGNITSKEMQNLSGLTYNVQQQFLSVAEQISYLKQHGISGPYLKSAEVSSDNSTLTITKSDDSKVIFNPSVGPGGGGTLETVLLTSDLYTYTPIGKITQASNTDPKLVASQGQSLKNVFNTILGTQQDANPEIKTNVSLSCTQGGSTTISVVECETSVAAQTGVSIKFAVSSLSGSAQYGFKAGAYDTYQKSGSYVSFNYPIKTRYIDNKSYQIRVQKPTTLRSGNTLTSSQSVYEDSTYLYCTVNSSNSVSLTLNLVSEVSTTSQIVRCSKIVADVEFDAPQYNGVNIDYYYTFLKSAYSVLPVGTSTSAESKPYTISASNYFPYSTTSSDTVVPTAGTRRALSLITSSGQQGINYEKYNYLWILNTTGGIKTIQIYSDLTSSWSSMLEGTTSPEEVSFKMENGVYHTYYAYRTLNVSQSTGNALIRLQ